MSDHSPYDFIDRRGGDKKRPAYHHRLEEKRHDVAFEIAWTTQTSTALNPCTDYGIGSFAFGKEGEYAGYNNRWLIINNCLVISPFTVKSAVANGFANLLGGCLRVIEKESGHKDVKPGTYLYIGGWKRYRVAWDGSSKPGVVLERKDNSDGSRYFKIQPVREFYYDCTLPALYSPWKRGDTSFITLKKDHDPRPPIIDVDGLSLQSKSPQDIKVEYQGPCERDMYTERKHHDYRFIERLPGYIEGTLRKENFIDVNRLKGIIYAGSYRKKGMPWYQDLSKINKDDFVYYEEFNGVLSHIGKNFLFKALFYHPDTILDENKACKKMEELCPRCAMFGMSDETKRDDKEAVGFRGRFKAAALVCDRPLEEKPSSQKIPVWKDEKIIWKDPQFKSWHHNGEDISLQVLLPILGPPKPNKRDINGYFDPQKGLAKGVKRYFHANLTIDELMRLIAEEDNGERATKYAHHLRPCAQVCKEGLVFTGVVGAENCSLTEIAALLILLESDLARNGFKIGLGKALGMGSIKSSVRRIWVREAKNYKEWHLIGISDAQQLPQQLDSKIPGLLKEYEGMIKTDEMVKNLNHLLEKSETKALKFPDRGPSYWIDFWSSEQSKRKGDKQKKNFHQHRHG